MQSGSLRRVNVLCHGGLGNQIFEYAAGLYYAQRASVPLEILRPLGAQESLQSFGYARPFQLDAFYPEGTVRMATRTDRLFLSTRPGVVSIRNRLRGISGTHTIVEQVNNHFIPDLLDATTARTIYLSGYWQSARFAEAIENRLRRSLQLRNTPQQRNLDYAAVIRTLQCPVSLHLRIGDYACHSTTDTKGSGKISLVLHRSYFSAAIARIRSFLPDASFVVFSDDMTSAREILSGEPISLWVEGNDTDHAYEDLWLMSCCKHHIIANSSFSWWGAWLNPSPDKIVLAPKYWHNTHHSYFPELCPLKWTLIDNLA